MAKNFQGHDCVFSSLGNMGLCSSESFPQQSMLQIITAMHSAKLKRIILVSSQYTKRKLKYQIVFKKPLLIYKVLISKFTVISSCIQNISSMLSRQTV